MGAKESKDKMDDAKKSLHHHLDDLKNNENQLFRCTWENNYFYVISYSFNNELTSQIYKKKLLYEKCKPDHIQECTICLYNIKDKACKIEGCNHMFHTNCLEKHIKMNDNACCPLCRGGNDMYIISQMIESDSYSYSSSSSYNIDDD